MEDMSERSLRYLEKSDFGGTRSRTGKRKPNQLYVCDTTTQWFDWPRGPHFNKLPVQLILEIFKYLLAYELLRKVSLVCKYWYNLCRDRTLWTSITWNGTQITLENLLQLTKYQVHELVLTDNLCLFSDMSLAHVLKICTHLKCLKLPRNAGRELFKLELPRTDIQGGKPSSHAHIYIGIRRHSIHRLVDDSSRAREYDFCRTLHHSISFRQYYDSFLALEYSSVHLNRCVEDPSLAREYEEDVEIALASVEHKRFLTPEEFLAKHKKDCRYDLDADTIYVLEDAIESDLFSDQGYLPKILQDYIFSKELKSLECLLRPDCDSRSAIFYEKNTKAPSQSFIRIIPFRACRMNRRQQQPSKIKPRPPKGRNNHHKEVKKFRRLRKRFKLYSLK